MIKGCVGFSHVRGRLFGTMILVRGKRTIDIPLPWFVIPYMSRLWTRKNILGKFLFKKNTDWQDILKTKI